MLPTKMKAASLSRSIILLAIISACKIPSSSEALAVATETMSRAELFVNIVDNEIDAPALADAIVTLTAHKSIDGCLAKSRIDTIRVSREPGTKFATVILMIEANCREMAEEILNDWEADSRFQVFYDNQFSPFPSLTGTN